MVNILQQYHAFLDEKQINDIQDLILELVCEPHSIILIEDEKYPELLMLNISDDTDLDVEINHIFNGIIINKDNIRKIMCYSGKYMDFITSDEVTSLFDLKLKKLKFYEARDGMSVRLFYYNNEWVLSTDKTIDANKEPSIGEHSLSIKALFDLCCQNMNFNYKYLNRNYIYVFGVYHQLNRNVIQHKNNIITHIKTYSINSIKEVDINLNLQKIQEVTFKNLFNLLEVYNKSEWTTPGFIIENLENKKLYKILTPNFVYVQLLKGLDDDKIIRFIKLNQNNLIDEYLRYFDEDKKMFELLKRMFNYYTYYFYKSYVDLKIHKIEKPLNKYLKYEMDIIYKIHGLYLRTTHNTSINSVETILKSYDQERLKELLSDRDLYTIVLGTQ